MYFSAGETSALGFCCRASATTSGTFRDLNVCRGWPCQQPGRSPFCFAIRREVRRLPQGRKTQQRLAAQNQSQRQEPYCGNRVGQRLHRLLLRKEKRTFSLKKKFTATPQRRPHTEGITRANPWIVSAGCRPWQAFAPEPFFHYWDEVPPKI